MDFCDIFWAEYPGYLCVLDDYTFILSFYITSIIIGSVLGIFAGLVKSFINEK